MDFEKAVSLIGTVTDLRRIASAHVIDHNQLKDEELRSALVKSKPQYTAAETVKKALDELLSREPKDHVRALNRILLVDVLLDHYDSQLPFEESDAKVTAVEQYVIDRSNELDLEQLACGDKGTPRYRDFETYNFVLGVAWEQRDSVSADEANLLSNLRRHLRVNQFEHRVLEAKLRRFPKTGNELHTRVEITAARHGLHQAGLLFAIRQDGTDFDVIPDELATELRAALNIELRTDAYRELLRFWKVRTKAHLTEVLERAGIAFMKSDKVDALVERVVLNVPPSKAIASASPRYGLSSEELADWCRDLEISPSGPIEDRVGRVIGHFAALRPRVEADVDERSLWYDFYNDLAARNRDVLRAQHLIEKDGDDGAQVRARDPLPLPNQARPHPTPTTRHRPPRWPAQPQVRLPHVGQQVEGCPPRLPPQGLHPAVRPLHERRRQTRSHLPRHRARFHGRLRSRSRPLPRRPLRPKHRPDHRDRAKVSGRGVVVAATQKPRDAVSAGLAGGVGQVRPKEAGQTRRLGMALLRRTVELRRC
jgi:hypothetical protein